MFRNMVTSLFKHERIRTTDAKAKEIRRWADKLVTLAKRGDLHARRQALSIIREKDVVHKLFDEAPKRFAQVNGGYTRVVKVGFRPGDAAPISLVELVTPEVKKKKTRRKKKTVKTAAPQAAPMTEPSETPTSEEKPREEAGATTAPEGQGAVAPQEESAEDAPIEEASQAAAPAEEEAPLETAPAEVADAPTEDDTPAEEPKKDS
jgi:large subunit ribosomal protein L17